MTIAVLLSVFFVLTPPAISFAEVSQTDAGDTVIEMDGTGLVAEVTDISEDEAAEFLNDAEGPGLNEEDSDAAAQDEAGAAGEEAGAADEGSPAQDEAADPYDAELFTSATEELDGMQDASTVEIVKAAYEITLKGFNKDNKSSAAVFLSDLLTYKEIDNILLTGKNEADEDAEWVIVRLKDGEDCYVLHPAADIGREDSESADPANDEEAAGDGTETADKAAEAKYEGFLRGAAYVEGWVPDEESADADILDAYRLSEEDYSETEEAEEAAEPEEGKEDAEKAEESAKEEGKDREIEVDGATETSINLGSCGSNATARLGTTNGESTYTLYIDGSGAMNDFSSSGGSWKNSSYKSKITKIVIGKSITKIGNYAFYGMNAVKSMSFKGARVAYIGNYAFYNCYNLTRLSLPSGVTYIGDHAFYNCSGLKTVSIGSGAHYIGNYAFAYCSNLSSVTLPETVNIIGDYAFYGDNALTSIGLPSGLKTLGKYAVYNCKTVYYHGTNTGWKRLSASDAISSTASVKYSKKLTGAKVSMRKTSYVYKAKALKPGVTVKLKVKGKYVTLKKGRDYRVVYKNNTNAGKATLTVEGINKYYGSIKKTFRITKKSVSKAKVTGIRSHYYTGKAIKQSPVVKVKIGSKYIKLKKNRDYTVKYKNNKNVSTKSSMAVVTIVGKGNYKGKISKKFKVVKAPVGLKFKASKVTRKSAAGSFTRTPTKKVKAKLTYTYSSSNPSVATVNKKTGRVTPLKIGTTKITVKSKATKNYRAGKATYKVTVTPLALGDLTYNFGNYSKTTISESTFRMFFSATMARSYYNYYYDVGDGGVCFGMASSSMMLNMAGSALRPSYFSSSASHPSALSKYSRFKSTSYYLYDFIEAMHVSQLSDACQNRLYANSYDVKGLVKQVKTGKPVLISMKSSYGGHAIVGYKMEKYSSSLDLLYIYDSNYPNSTRYIQLVKNSSGKYTGEWFYDYDFCSPYRISYISGPTYKSIWKNRKAANKVSQLFVTTDSFEIRDSSGTVVATMKKGKFTSNSDDVYLADTLGLDLSANLVYLPNGEYSVTNTAKNGDGFEVTSMDVDQSITVATDSKTVTVETNDETGVNTATIDTAKDEDFMVTILDGTESEEPEETVFTGAGNSKKIKLGKDGGKYVIDNTKDVKMKVDGKKKNFSIKKGNVEVE